MKKKIVFLYKTYLNYYWFYVSHLSWVAYPTFPLDSYKKLDLNPVIKWIATPLNKRLSASRLSVFVGIGKISGLQQTVFGILK